MSVTFFVPGAPQQTVHTPCDMFGCKEGDRCGYCNDGVCEDQVSEAPKLNLANGNARALLNLLGRHSPDLYGEWHPHEVALVRRKILVLRNCPSKLQPATREAETLEEKGRATLFSMGLDIEGLLERLSQLDSVLAYAVKENKPVAWD